MKISLESVASIINDNIQETGLKTHAEEVYLDYGANLKWKTIVVTGDFMEYQLLSPSEEKILTGDYSLTEKMDLVSKLIGRLKRKAVK